MGNRVNHVRLSWKLKDLQSTSGGWGEIDLEPRGDIVVFNRTELIERLNARNCERCGRSDLPCEVHHLRRLSDM